MILTDAQKNQVGPAAKTVYRTLEPYDKLVITDLITQMKKQGIRGMGQETALEILAAIGIKLNELDSKD